MNSRSACRLFAALLLTAGTLASAAPGDLDPTFGHGGKVTTPFGNAINISYAMGVQPDGKIVLAGYAYIGSGNQFALVRYKANGALDTSFGDHGKVLTVIGTSAVINGLAIQADGKIVVGGNTFDGVKDNFAAARYLSNGSLDPSFGTGGTVVTAIGTHSDVGSCLALAPDGKILVAGKSDNGSDNDMAVVRYLSDGTLDPTFGGTGKVTVPVGASHDSCYNVTVQTDRKVVLTGASLNGSFDDIAVVRLNENGTLDTSFNTTGKVALPIGAGSLGGGNDVAIQMDGKIVVAAQSSNGSNLDLAILRLDASGALDPTFHGTGVAQIDFAGGDDYGFDVAVLPNGKILVGGRAFTGIKTDFALVRFQPDGTLDPSFGNGGKVTTGFQGAVTDIANSVAVQSDGRIVIGGVSFGNVRSDFAIARYIGAAAPGPILAGPILNPANNHVYYLLSQDDWPQSEARAQALGGHLATINDAAENQFVFDTFSPTALAQKTTGFKSLWIGFNDVDTEGTFVWSSGETPSFPPLWYPGQPQVGPGDEDFVGIALNLLTPGYWHDIVGRHAAGDVTYGVVEVVPIEPVANTGGDVPGEPMGTTFFDFSNPAIDAGLVGGAARIKPPNSNKTQTVIYGDTGGLVLARNGGTAAPGEIFSSLGDPVFAGEAFGFSAVTKGAPTASLPLRSFLLDDRFGLADNLRARTLAPGRSLAGLFSRISRANPPKPLVRQGDNARGTDGQFTKLPSFGLPRNRPGLVYTGQLRRGGTVTKKNDFGVWRETDAGGDSDLLLRTGTATAVMGGGMETFAKVEVMIPVANASDQRRSFAPDGGVMAAATLADGTPGVVRVNADRSVEVVQRQNSAVPGIAGAQWESFSAPASRSGGGYAVFAHLLAHLGGVTPQTNHGIFAAVDGINLRGIARRGDSFPGNNDVRLSRLGQPAMGQSGLVAFLSALSGRGVTPRNRTAIMASRDGVRTAVARLGDAAPEAGPGVTYRRFISVVVTDTAAGQVVFTATIGGPGVTARNNLGLFSTTPTGEVKLLLRSGQVTRVNDKTPLVRSFTSLTAPRATQGQGRSTDADGFVTAKVRLSDGRTGVLRIPLP